MDDTHYEVLGIPPRADLQQVEKAYRHCLALYDEGSVATYSLLDPAELRSARSRVQQAYEVLRDPARRHAYDVERGIAPAGAPLLPFPSPPGAGAPAPPSNEPPAVPDPVMGAHLRRFREWRGITLKDIAVSSKIGVRFLQYIEEDRFAGLPAVVYLRGFLQEYARAVGLDPRRIADSYLSRLPRR
jgi:flagellar biosynthesis protein FlhG